MFFCTKIALVLAVWWPFQLKTTPTPTPTPTPIVVKATPTPTPTPARPIFESPEAPALSPLGESLIIEFEVGGRSGYNQHPELPDRRLSGVTIAVGYDLHQNAPGAIIADWMGLSAPAPARLAATHAFYGQNAVEPWHKVQDIVVPWMAAYEVFTKIDVAREYARAVRALPGFEDLRPNAQAALISLTFNRGTSMTGDNRKEMRIIRDLVPKKDYAGMAAQLRKMVRVWAGTSIYKGMQRRRLAEATLMETP